MEPRLQPVNAVLDLLTPDGLNPAPLFEAGWRTVALELPVKTELGVAVCDVVLFHELSGTLLIVEAKSGANIEDAQAGKLARITAPMLVAAAGITLRSEVTLSVELLYACEIRHAERVGLGLTMAKVDAHVLVHATDEIVLVRSPRPDSVLGRILREPVRLARPIANVIPFDHESPDEAFDRPVRAALVAASAQMRPTITIAALTEEVVWHLAIYGKASRSRLTRKVSGAARRAAAAEPQRLRYEPATGLTDPRMMILQSPEGFDRRGRTQSYQAMFNERTLSAKRRPPIPGQTDLLAELDRAEDAALDDADDDVSGERDAVVDGERMGSARDEAGGEVIDDDDTR